MIMITSMLMIMIRIITKMIIIVRVVIMINDNKRLVEGEASSGYKLH